MSALDGLARRCREYAVVIALLGLAFGLIAWWIHLASAEEARGRRHRWESVCIDEVVYLRFAEGVTVAYTRSGRIKTCVLEGR